MIRWLSFLWLILFSSQATCTQLLILGDSLSAGYQMPIEQAWPSLLPDALKKHDRTVSVINGSVSGDTTGNALARLPKLLKQHAPEYVLIELGANDGLRGFTPSIPKKNLVRIIDLISQSGGKPILMQIRIPPNYGQRYSRLFSAIYTNISDIKQVPLIPFFLEQVIIRPEWMKDDGLHPNAKAQPWIADTVARQIAPLLM
ncbi:arylesterase [Vibrio quintilis]|uniref:Arylesterase n=1 Tax=Vibrio quintilis TaxID=1117707 RepID=A0A1M7YS26_9VIBR|nr:arylesterase [Vibrio quintilis]SHO55434.1 Arylesterase precursor [Vibrio quintilis]